MKQNITKIEDALKIGAKCLRNREYEEAEKAFQSILQMDEIFTSFESLNNVIKYSAPGKLPFELALNTRKAMMCLGIIYALKENTKLAEDYVLNATYLCQDAEINLLGGNFYLAIRDAELDTAFGFFKRAAMLKPGILWKCDELVRNFVHGKRAIFYPFGSLQPYIEHWNSIKDKISQEKSQNTISDFVKSALSALEDLDAMAPNLILKMMRREV